MLWFDIQWWSPTVLDIEYIRTHCNIRLNFYSSHCTWESQQLHTRSLLAFKRSPAHVALPCAIRAAASSTVAAPWTKAGYSGMPIVHEDHEDHEGWTETKYEKVVACKSYGSIMEQSSLLPKSVIERPCHSFRILYSKVLTKCEPWRFRKLLGNPSSLILERSRYDSLR